ncbi:MAG TPA: hypothetical protein VF714_07370 [Jatrophihabitans sp.]
MNRLRTSRPPGHWTESVVIRSYEAPLADPDPAMPLPPLPAPVGPLRLPRVVPAWMVVAALLLACAAAGTAALWWQHRSRVVEVTNRMQAYYTTGPDAAGCPNLTRCQVRVDPGQPLAALARRLFPDATVLSAVAVTDTRTGRTVHSTVVLRAPSGLEVSATAQCVPGAGPIPGRVEPLPQMGPAQADFVVAGAPGCSVAVAAQIPRAVRVPLVELRQLAVDRQAQLDPSR